MISELVLENQLFMLQGNMTATLNETTSVDTIKNSNSIIVIYLETQPSTCVCVLGKLFGLRMLQVQIILLSQTLFQKHLHSLFPQIRIDFEMLCSTTIKTFVEHWDACEDNIVVNKKTKTTKTSTTRQHFVRPHH